jgi:hypothetical protein
MCVRGGDLAAPVYQDTRAWSRLAALRRTGLPSRHPQIKETTEFHGLGGDDIVTLPEAGHAVTHGDDVTLSGLSRAIVQWVERRF